MPVRVISPLSGDLPPLSLSHSSLILPPVPPANHGMRHSSHWF
jgi:hypothetical protein